MPLQRSRAAGDAGCSRAIMRRDLPRLGDSPRRGECPLLHGGSLTGKDSAGYVPNAAICLETRKFPDSIHHADWPSVRLDPGETYRHVVVHRFTRY